ncbi:AMP-binding protein [Angelakisella massiliensis]|uniref:AMP-binding protein n=1 Tax=Angelakisella massiliensis TaxID=1871018 RepID=UPI0024B1686E|nr:AMP-binding protein [Angelakisella massiliensis]
MIEKFIGRTDYATYEDFKANYRLRYPANFNFATHVVDAWSAEEPDKLALLYCNDHGEERYFTFRDISRLSRKAACYLRSLGIGKGDRVIIQLKRRWEYWVTAVALHRLGAILIPCSYQMAAKDLVYRINAAEVKLLIAVEDPWVLQQVEESRGQCPTLENIALVGAPREGWLDFSRGLEEADDSFIIDSTLTAEDPMIIYFTSGTTGYPKMVVHRQSYPLGHIPTAAYWQQVENNGLHLTVVDSGWAKFGWGCIYGQWLAGTAMLGYDADNKFNPRNLINVIARYKPTTICVPGTIYRFMMREGLTREDFASVHHCCTAGEPLSPEIVREFEEVTGLTIHEGYGQSESSVLVANYGWFPPKAGSMGKPSPLYDIALINGDGKPCLPGEEGELVVRNLGIYFPEGLFYGYMRDGKVVPAYDENYVYHTGDVCWMDEEGYYWFVGRNDDMIKCSAYRIGPFEIESVLMTHPSVRECAITGAPDPIRGQVVKATIVLEKGWEPTEALTKELQNYVKKQTAPYKYPRVVEYVAELPKTTSGKIIRNKLREASNHLAQLQAKA